MVEATCWIRLINRGSFSCLMRATRNEELICWVAPVAGHVLDDLARQVLVARRDTGSLISLEVASGSIRRSSRPQALSNEAPSFRDECAFLMVNQSDLHVF